MAEDDRERTGWVDALADLVAVERLVGLLARIDTVDASAAAQIRARLDDRAQPLAEDEAIVMLVDIVDSTRWTLELGSVEFRRRARTVERHLRGAIVAAGGRLGEGVNLGDGVVAEFPSADAAFLAARDMHTRMLGDDLEVRTGVHTGEVAREGNVISGTAINVAARTSDAASPGGAMISAATRRSLSASHQALTIDEGGFVMKGLAEPMQLYSVVMAD